MRCRLIDTSAGWVFRLASGRDSPTVGKLGSGLERRIETASRRALPVLCLREPAAAFFNRAHTGSSSLRVIDWSVGTHHHHHAALRCAGCFFAPPVNVNCVVGRGPRWHG